jgi:hypothetical protein
MKNLYLFALCFALFAGSATCHAANVTLDFSNFPANLPPGSGQQIYTQDLYNVGTDGTYVYAVTATSFPTDYDGTNAVANGSSANLMVSQIGGAAFDLSSIALATFGPETGPIFVTISGINSLQTATETVSTPGELFDFDVSITDATTLIISAVDAENNAVSLQATDMVVSANTSYIAPAPEPTSVVLLGLGFAGVVLAGCRKTGKARDR